MNKKERYKYLLDRSIYKIPDSVPVEFRAKFPSFSVEVHEVLSVC